MLNNEKGPGKKMSISTEASQLSDYLRLTFKPHMTGELDIQATRLQGEAMTSSQMPASEDVQISEKSLGGISTEQLLPHAFLPDTAILYLHGGGWNAGSAHVVRPITWRLAKLTGIPVYAINYRLAPEYPYPAGLDDCVQAYDALLEQGLPASSIVVAGDSAGGNLALALALYLKSNNKPQPAALACLSPYTDLTCSGNSIRTNVDSDVFITSSHLEALARVYSPQDDLTNPLLSPLYGDVAGFPPTYLLVSAAELLLDDSRRLAEKMKIAGVDVILDVWSELWHDWTVFSDQIPEGKQAIEAVAMFISNLINKQGA
jgi:monoterpene epsilon-lactone hydrolase